MTRDNPANNVPGFGYANKIYTSFTGLFTSSPIFPTASYGITVAPVPTLTYPNNLQLQVTKIDKINSVDNNMVLQFTHNNLVFNQTNNNSLSLDQINFPIDVIFSLDGELSTRWNYRGVIKDLSNPLTVSNVELYNSNSAKDYDFTRNYKEAKNIIFYFK